MPFAFSVAFYIGFMKAVNFTAIASFCANTVLNNDKSVAYLFKLSAVSLRSSSRTNLPAIVLIFLPAFLALPAPALFFLKR
ncbi:MAG: hypothetical protein IPJ81_09900 [Chitinophagaceae bacterium]|nr:hypothetical protein [Chitinophagaceae bacterium]MBK7884065.1 hypothetical protein [Chitinophagaceae bacterium]